VAEIKLNGSEMSALECRAGGGLEPVTERACRDGALVFDAADAEEIAGDILDCGNAEYDAAEMKHPGGSKSAGRALCGLSWKVRAAIAQEESR
jgi:hypothetical protein